MPARWKYGFLCDGAMQVYGKWTYQGIFGEINALAYPAVHAEAVLAFRFNGPVGPHVLRIQLTDSAGKAVSPAARLTIECQEFKDNEIVVTLKPLGIPAAGFYSFQIFMDEEAQPFGTIEFRAMKQTLPNQPKPGGGV
jgi:hypothetical protein